MNQSIVEYVREQVVIDLFGPGKTFTTTMNEHWLSEIRSHIPIKTANNFYNLGDHLSDVFRSSSSVRTQSSVSGGGAAWEILICWYLNLCLINTRTVVVKTNKHKPTIIKKAMTVKYGNVESNSENDLVAITFPDKIEYREDKNVINITNQDTGNHVPLKRTPRSKKYNLIPILDALMTRDFVDTEIAILQLKTNWNDNAQIPMLWDMVYAANGVPNRNIYVGTHTYNPQTCKSFSYSFITVPTNNLEQFTPTATAVERVTNLSGGNFWGYPSQNGIATNVKDIIQRNFRNNTFANNSYTQNFNSALQHLNSTFSYFNY